MRDKSCTHCWSLMQLFLWQTLVTVSVSSSACASLVSESGEMRVNFATFLSSIHCGIDSGITVVLVITTLGVIITMHCGYHKQLVKMSVLRCYSLTSQSYQNEIDNMVIFTLELSFWTVIYWQCYITIIIVKHNCLNHYALSLTYMLSPISRTVVQSK